MTSAPITANVMSFFKESPNAVASTGKDAENSFSDVLKSQSSDGKTAEPEKDVVAPARVDSRTDRVAEKPVSVKQDDDGEVTLEEAMDYAENAAEEVAAEMVIQAAAVLGISEEEVMSLLEGLGMTEDNLLTAEGLQALTLAAAGESDLNSFMTDENLFSNFQDLQSKLDELVKQVADETGLDEGYVHDTFVRIVERIMEDSTETVEFAVQEEIAVEEDMPEPKAVIDAVETQTASEGAGVMLQRSMANSETGNQTNQFSQGNNSFVPTQPMQNIAENVMNVQEVSSYFDADTEMIMRQITDYMKGNVTDGVSELEMQLHPESLGSLHVKLTAKEGVVTAQFTTQNEAVKNVLESQMIQLKETFKEQGVTVENIEVEVQTNGFEHSLGQNGGQQTGSEGQEAERPRARRLNLSELEELGIELTEEEQLAAEMMKENGNTVDYTV